MNYSKLANYETMAHREGMLQHLKETDYWGYCESREYDGNNPHGCFYDLLIKSVGKNAKEIFNIIKANPRYKKNFFFKRETDKLIKGCRNRVHIRTGYYSPWTNTDFYVDLEGNLQVIEKHPLYLEIQQSLNEAREKEYIHLPMHYMVRRIHEHLTEDIIVKVKGKYYYAKQRNVLTEYESYSLGHSRPSTVYCHSLSLVGKKDLEYFELK